MTRKLTASYPAYRLQRFRCVRQQWAVWQEWKRRLTRCSTAASRVTYLGERSAPFCGIPFVRALPVTSGVEELLCLLGLLELGLMPAFPCVVMWYLYAKSLPASVPHTHAHAHAHAHILSQTQDILEAFQRKVSQTSNFSFPPFL